LIDKGAYINALNKDNETPLFYAVRKSMPAVVRFLIQHGADVNIVDSYGDKAYDIALDSRTRECFSTKLIVSNSNYNSSSNSNSTDSSNDNNFPEVKYGMPSNFPYETLIKVFLYLEAKDVCRAACVSGKWHRGHQSIEIYLFL
jgi:ankyrin repeat protein